MNEIKKIFEENKSGRKANKWMHYFEIYEDHLSRFKDQDISILEVGVRHGGSLDIWEEYFGDDSYIYGVDIDDRCKRLEKKGMKIIIGDQSDEDFLQRLSEEIGELEIIIDDGGHKMDQQIKTFENLYGNLSDGGVYICEDTHTSYWPTYGGGLRKKGTFIEKSKSLTDKLHEWHYVSDDKVSGFCKNTKSISFYDSVVVIEKKGRKKPHSETRGEPTLEDTQSKKELVDKITIRYIMKYIKRNIIYPLEIKVRNIIYR